MFDLASLLSIVPAIALVASLVVVRRLAGDQPIDLAALFGHAAHPCPGRAASRRRSRSPGGSSSSSDARRPPARGPRPCPSAGPAAPSVHGSGFDRCDEGRAGFPLPPPGADRCATGPSDRNTIGGPAIAVSTPPSSPGRGRRVASARRRSSPRAWSRSTAAARARSARSTASTSWSRKAPSSACSARTARARRRPSGSSRRCSAPTRAAPPWRGSTSGRRRTPIRRVIGLSGQYAAVDENLTGRENLWLFGRLYHLPSPEARRRADELLEQFELTDAADRVVKTYSGGMRRRLDLGAALIGRPAAADPRRADDGPRPAQPDRDVGRDPRASSARARRSC